MQERPCEEAARGWPFASHGERPHRKPSLPVVWSWTSSLQNCEKIIPLFKPRYGSPGKPIQLLYSQNTSSWLVSSPEPELSRSHIHCTPGQVLLAGEETLSGLEKGTHRNGGLRGLGGQGMWREEVGQGLAACARKCSCMIYRALHSCVCLTAPGLRKSPHPPTFSINLSMGLWCEWRPFRGKSAVRCTARPAHKLRLYGNQQQQWDAGGVFQRDPTREWLNWFLPTQGKGRLEANLMLFSNDRIHDPSCTFKFVNKIHALCMTQKQGSSRTLEAWADGVTGEG